MPTRFKNAFILSIFIIVLAAIASAGGLLLDSLYHDNDFVRTTWLGNDAVTLFLAVPILAAALVFAVRGSLKAQLLWLGALDYMLYNYAFYLFGVAFNGFFLVYTALFGLSIFALIFGAGNLDVNAISRQFSPKTPTRWIAGYFLFVAVGLSAVYVIQSIGFILTGQLPAIVERSGHPTSIVFALDLTLLVPWLVLGAFWLVKRNPWGFVIAGILSVKGPLYTLVLTVNTWLLMQTDPSFAAELPLWAMLCVLGLAVSGLLFRNMKPAS